MQHTQFQLGTRILCGDKRAVVIVVTGDSGDWTLLIVLTLVGVALCALLLTAIVVYLWKQQRRDEAARIGRRLIGRLNFVELLRRHGDGNEYFGLASGTSTVSLSNAPLQWNGDEDDSEQQPSSVFQKCENYRRRD